MRVGKPRMDKYPKIKLVCIMRWNRPEYRINRIRTKIFNRFHMDMVRDELSNLSSPVLKECLVNMLLQ